MQVINPNGKGYWEERWELYKYVYYMAIWAYDHRIQNVELYNEVRAWAQPCSNSPVINLQWQVCCATVRIVHTEGGYVSAVGGICLVLKRSLIPSVLESHQEVQRAYDDRAAVQTDGVSLTSLRESQPNLDGQRDGCHDVAATWLQNAAIRSEALQACSPTRTQDSRRLPLHSCRLQHFSSGLEPCQHCAALVAMYTRLIHCTALGIFTTVPTFSESQQSAM